MNKVLFDYSKDIGSDGAKVSGALGIDAGNLSLNVAVSYPLAKVVEPALKLVDKTVDKLEELIPFDQKKIAEKIKAEAREELLKLIQDELAKA